MSEPDLRAPRAGLAPAERYSALVSRTKTQAVSVCFA
jgi:hypothetical protein